MVNEAQCGIFVPSGDANALAKQFLVFSKLEKSELHDMGIRGRQWIFENRTYQTLGLRYLNEVLMK